MADDNDGKVIDLYRCIDTHLHWLKLLIAALIYFCYLDCNAMHLAHCHNTPTH